MEQNHAIARLDPVKIARTIQQKENGMPNQQMANSMKGIYKMDSKTALQVLLYWNHGAMCFSKW
jgi:hypothetical protein